ncbi:MAG: hypothetical protein AAB263_01175, partial [Planctomycetota bacterium]
AKGKSTGKKIKKPKEYEPAEIAKFENLILGCIGFYSAKDIVAKQPDVKNINDRFKFTVQSMDLYQAPAEAVAQAGPSLPIPGAIADWIGYGLVGVVAIGLLVIARGQLRRSHKAWAEAEERDRVLREEADAAKKKEALLGADPNDEVKSMIQARRAELKAMIKKSIVSDPSAAAQIVKNWLAK